MNKKGRPGNDRGNADAARVAGWDPVRYYFLAYIALLLSQENVYFVSHRIWVVYALAYTSYYSISSKKTRHLIYSCVPEPSSSPITRKVNINICSLFWLTVVMSAFNWQAAQFSNIKFTDHSNMDPSPLQCHPAPVFANLTSLHVCPIGYPKKPSGKRNRKKAKHGRCSTPMWPFPMGSPPLSFDLHQVLMGNHVPLFVWDNSGLCLLFQNNYQYLHPVSHSETMVIPLVGHSTQFKLRWYGNSQHSPKMVAFR